MLLKEEMRRVRWFLEWKAIWWEARSKGWDGLDASVAEGVRAYGLRQMTIQRALSTEFTRLWDAPLLHDASVDVGEGEEQVVNPAWEALAGQLEFDSDDEDDS
jgi:hypothetical protein